MDGGCIGSLGLAGVSIESGGPEAGHAASGPQGVGVSATGKRPSKPAKNPALRSIWPCRRGNGTCELKRARQVPSRQRAPGEGQHPIRSVKDLRARLLLQGERGLQLRTSTGKKLAKSPLDSTALESGLVRETKFARCPEYPWCTGYNEEESLGPLWNALQPVMESLDRPWEVVFIDDGSSDTSAALLEEMADKHPQIKVVFFRRNFGQTAAMDAGFKHASGEIVIAMDADLQNDPADIPMLLTEMESGVDVVKGWRKNRRILLD